MSMSAKRKQVIGGANAEGLPISLAVKFGDLVFVSGTVAFDDQDRIVTGGIGPETRQTFRNIEKVLATAGCSLADILKVNVVLSDAGDFDAFNAVYKTIFPKNPPARVTMAAQLTIDARIEVDVVAGMGAGA
jgi:2-iminobutanoate/2-iminopropanoate deaminase